MGPFKLFKFNLKTMFSTVFLKILILSIFVKYSKVLKFMPNQHRELSFELLFFNCQCASYLEKAMAPHSSTLAWKIPWTEEPGRLQSMGLLRVRHDWATSLSPFSFMHWRRKWQPTPVFLPGESRDGGAWWVPSLGSHRVRHDWSDLAAAAAAVE